jgi:beta-glucanase (GH16 family)
MTSLPRARLLRAGVSVLAIIAAMIAAASNAAASLPPPPSGWTQVFADDFSGAANTGLNTSNWLYDLGTGYPGGAANWGTGEVESMTNSTQNVYQDGAGHLVIRPIRNGSGGWTSGRVETQRTDFAAPAGGKLRLEASLQQPNVSGTAAAGYWPAFWSLGAAARGVGATNWPGVGEIDMMEDINGLSSEFGTLHCGVAPGGPCNEYTGLGSGQRACGGCQTGFHTYAMEDDRSVSPEQIRWYLDGNNFFTVNANQVDATTWNNATHHGFFMILNVAMGGSFPGAFGGGPTGSTASGVPMVVDYVAAYTAGGGTPPPPGHAITGIAGLCLDDRSSSTANFNPDPDLDLQRHCRAAMDRGGGRQHPARAGQVPGHQRRRHRQRHQGGPLRLQQHRRAGVDPAVEWVALQPAVKSVSGRARIVNDTRHPGADLGLQRHRRAALDASVLVSFR